MAGARAWWLIGLVVVLAASGCTPEPVALPPRAVQAPTPTTADNERETRRFSAYLLTAVPMPAGSRRWRHSPVPYFRVQTTFEGPSDPHYARATWWTVPISRQEFAPWVRAHTPAGLVADALTSDVPRGPRGSILSGQNVDARGNAAHTGGSIYFSYLAHGDGIVVRVDTFTGARFARTVRVPADTRAVTIRKVIDPTFTHRPTRTLRRTVSDARSVARLVKAVNGLQGASTSQYVGGSCGPVPDERFSYEVSFSSPAGTYVADFAGMGVCSDRVTLLHDDVKAGPPLALSGEFVDAVDGYLPKDTGGS